MTGTTFQSTETYDFTGTVASVTNAHLDQTAYVVSIDWGDGSSTSSGSYNGGSSGGSSFDITGEHTYGDAGTYPVTVTVSDSGGNIEVVDSTADVADGTLTMAGASPFTVTEGQSFTEPLGTLDTGTTFNSTGTGYESADEFFGTVDWGDGNVTPITAGDLQSPDSGGTYVLSGSHAYAEEGTYSIQVTIIDQGGSSTATETTASVVDAPIQATAGPLNATEGQPYSGTIASFTTADPASAAGNFTASIDWGDGTTSNGTVSADPSTAGQFLVTGDDPATGAGHAFAEEGTSTINVSIQDPGGSTATASTTATVADAALDGSGVENFGAVADETFSGTVATFTDADPNGTSSDYTATIDWGDGSQPSAGSITSGPDNSFVVAGVHTYATAQATQDAATVTIRDATASFVAVANYFAAPLPNITANYIQYATDRTKIFDGWTITGNIPSFTLAVYKSPTMTFNKATATQVASSTVINSSPGAHDSNTGFGGDLAGDPNNPYLFLVADPNNSIKESNENDNVAGPLAWPSVSVTTSGAGTYTLLDTATFTANLTPAGTAASIKFQMEGTGNPNWVDVGSAATVNMVQRVAGHFQVRAIATVGGIDFRSSPQNVVVQFPSYNQIVGNAAVKAKMDATWQATKDFATTNAGPQDAAGNYTQNLRKEIGFWIALDTSGAGAYSYPSFPSRSGRGDGAIVTDNFSGGGISPGDQPPDNPADPLLNQGGIYTVALFHTHTPMTYRYNVGARAVGPSGRDLRFDLIVPGIVYDYSPNPLTPPDGPIGPGYALNAPAKLYPFGPDRRGTP